MRAEVADKLRTIVDPLHQRVASDGAGKASVASSHMHRTISSERSAAKSLIDVGVCSFHIGPQMFLFCSPGRHILLTHCQPTIRHV